MEEAKQRIIENIKYSVEDPDLLKKISNIVGMVLDDYDIDRKEHIVICDNDQVNKDITDYIGQKRVEGKSEGTLELYTLYIRELYGYTKKNLRYISKDDIIGYFAYLESKGLSKCTIDSHRRVLNAFFRKMSDNGIILKSPMAMIGRIKYQEAERKPLTGREIAIVKRSCISERETAIFDILVSSGIRVAELVDLNRSDVDMHTGRIIIAHGKEDKRRSVYIDDEALV